MKNERPHKKLDVWQRAIKMVKKIYEISAGFPREEEFGLKAQIRRAAVSVPSNIAEGQARGHNPIEFARFLKIALGALAEVDTQLELAKRLGYLSGEKAKSADDLIAEVRRMLYGLINSLSSR